MEDIMEPLMSRVPHREKTEFQRTCEAIGTTPSNAIRIFVSRFNDCGGFPFDVRRRKNPQIAPNDPRIINPNRDANGTLIFAESDYNEADDIYDLQ